MKKRRSTSIVKQTLRLALVFTSSALLLYGLVSLKEVDIPTLMPVSEVTVEGELVFLDRDKLVAELKEAIKGGYFTLDLQRLRESLQQQPWVDEVSLRRQWPAGLLVSISEKKPVAYWNEHSFISDTGDVITPADRQEGLLLPVLDGPEGRHKDVWKFMNRLYGEMAILNYEVVALDLDERRAWELIITSSESVTAQPDMAQGRIIVKLGRFDTEKRLQRFVSILPVLLAEDSDANINDENRAISVIDMRYPNGFAVQLAGQQTDKQAEWQLPLLTAQQAITDTDLHVMSGNDRSRDRAGA